MLYYYLSPKSPTAFTFYYKVESSNSIDRYIDYGLKQVTGSRVAGKNEGNRVSSLIMYTSYYYSIKLTKPSKALNFFLRLKF